MAPIVLSIAGAVLGVALSTFAAVEVYPWTEGGAATMVWTLASAWPIKVTGNDLKFEGNEVAVETIVISQEGLTIAND